MRNATACFFLVFCSFANGIELPKRLYLFNFPDVLQQKISVSVLCPITNKKCFQLDVAFRQLFNYRKYYGSTLDKEPGTQYEKPFNSTQGFHLFVNVGYKYLKKRL